MGAIFKQIAVFRINCRCENEEWRLVSLDVGWLTIALRGYGQIPKQLWKTIPCEGFLFL